MMRIVLLVRDVEVTRRYFDEKAGKMVEETYNPAQVAQELGLKFCKMPENYPLYEKKGGKTTYLHEQGCFALARLENGRFLNNYNGQRLDRIQFLEPEDLVALKEIFRGDGDGTAKSKS